MSGERSTCQRSTFNVQRRTSRARARGHLHLVCAADAARAQLICASQSFRAPIHLSKPHLDEGVLVVNVVNPTAGLLAGDRIRRAASRWKAARGCC